MQLFPSRAAAHLTQASVGLMALGLLSQRPHVLAWGGSVLVAMALARIGTLVSVSRIRTAGFEMLWGGPKRLLRTARGGEFVVQAEVRNRDTRAARYVQLRALASPELEVRVEPSAGEVHASGRLLASVHIRATRVGRHALHGLALEVQGAPGLFEVPLTFANPVGVEVLPPALSTGALQQRGGRSKVITAVGRTARRRGEGNEIRELRDHHPGDPFRHVAWRASARRGKLLVREFEREERDVVWLLLDASVELWSGLPGHAPLDLAIDELASLASRYLARGDRVGLLIYAAKVRAHIPPDTGPGQAMRFAQALLATTSTHDASRSRLDEVGVAATVLEHLRPLLPEHEAPLGLDDLDLLAEKADSIAARAPFAASLPEGASERERRLRRYLAAWGLPSPASLTEEAPHALAHLSKALGKIARERTRPSVVHVFGHVPLDLEPSDACGKAIMRLRRQRALVAWSPPDWTRSLETRTLGRDEEGNPAYRSALGLERPAPWATLAAEALQLGMQAKHRRALRLLRRFGVRVRGQASQPR